jgi:hypothetical protein
LRSARYVSWLVLDEKRVIWTDSPIGGAGLGDLRACPKTGCPASGPAVLFADHAIGALASDGITAFASAPFFPDTGVHRLNANGTSTLQAPNGSVYWLGLRDTLLYINEYTAGRGRNVHVKGPGDPVAALLCTLPESTVNTDWSVVSTDRIFLGAHNFGAIYSCPRIGGSFTTYLENGDQSWVFAMATDGANLYWVDLLGRLNTCSANPASCTNPTTIFGPSSTLFAGSPSLLAESAGDLFILTSGGDLVGCKATDCPNTVKVLVHEPAFALEMRAGSSNLAVDDEDIYYVARDGAYDAGAPYRIMRLPRKPL